MKIQQILKIDVICDVTQNKNCLVYLINILFKYIKNNILH